MITARCAAIAATGKQERRQIEEAVRTSAYHIINYKGATYFAVGQALVRIVSAIVRNEKSVLTVSTVLEGEYGLNRCLPGRTSHDRGGRRG